MFAERAYEILRQLVAFVDVTAYNAHKAFLAFGLRLWLHIILILGISHRINI